MWINSDAADLLLPANGLIVLEAPGPVRIAVDSGELWVTQDGDATDYFVEAGESRVFDGRARPLAQAQARTALRATGCDVVVRAAGRPG